MTDTQESMSRRGVPSWTTGEPGSLGACAGACIEGNSRVRVQPQKELQLGAGPSLGHPVSLQGSNKGGPV